LRGGAGLAQNSWYLHLAGYRTIALDFAPKTVEFLKQHRPEVCPVLGDVRNLSLENESVDGYWSLGVIEHFYGGHDVILNEMHRVIKNDGYLFLTFPHISKLRQIKAKKGLYEIWPGNEDLVADFYQFALDSDRVINTFEENGFKLIHKHSLDGVKGLKDEIKIGRSWMQALYDGKTLKTRLARRLLDILLRPWASHMALLVFKKQSDGCAL
jgi:SAM-dependent methyltransferase